MRPIGHFFDEDIQSTALCAWKEARGEGNEGILAVLCVLKNRISNPGFADNIHDIVYGKNQFSSMSIPSDPEFNLQPKPDDSVWQNCLDDASTVLNGSVDDVTGGACYYANLRWAKSGWFARVISGPDGMGTPEHPMTKDIGQQRFYR